MAYRWLVNAPLPGAQIKGVGIVKPGVEVETPEDPKDPRWERPRNMLIPLNAEAKAFVAAWNKAHPLAPVITKRLNLQAGHLGMGEDATIEYAKKYGGKR